jgi:hypothetical protein
MRVWAESCSLKSHDWISFFFGRFFLNFPIPELVVNLIPVISSLDMFYSGMAIGLLWQTAYTFCNASLKVYAMYHPQNDPKKTWTPRARKAITIWRTPEAPSASTCRQVRLLRVSGAEPAACHSELGAAGNLSALWDFRFDGCCEVFMTQKPCHEYQVI